MASLGADNLWRWTVSEGRGKPITAAPCVYHEGGHKTREEAEDCWWSWALRELTPIEGPERCCHMPDCPARTGRGLKAPDGISLWLCTRHENPETYGVLRRRPRFHSYAVS